MSGEVEKRKLIDLRVVELRSELEKRGLDKNGVKSLLIERLEKSLKEEGHDPDVYLFQISEKKSPVKRSSKRGEQDTESETQSNADENHDQDVDEDEREDELDKSNVQLEDGDGKEESVGKAVNAETKVDQVKVKVEKPEPMETDSEKEPAVVTKEVAKVEKPEVVTDAEKINDSSSKEPEKAPAPVADGDKNIPEANGLDNEDSINLTIGEEDEKLLAEEEDSSHEKDAKDEGSLHKKDEAAAAQDKDDKQASAAEDKQVKTDEQAASEDKMGVDKNKSVSQVSGDPKAVKDDKDKKKVVGIPAGSSRNLWVSGLSSSTRATDIKQVFSKYGKVIGAKVVTNARTPGARCYGYVTMATSEEATKCIQHLHRTELHGRMISVERAKGDSTGPPKKSETKSPVTKKAEEKKRHERKLSTSKGDEKKEEGEKIPAITDQALKDETKQEVKPAVKVESKNEAVSEDKTAAAKEEEKMLAEKREASRERKERERRRSAGSSHHSRHQSTSPHRGPAHHVSPVRRPGVLTFAQIREARERQRLRERERELREEERRRREEFNRQREIERRNKEEAMRLEREKEKLRLERERIERDRAELLRLERERQKLEREKLEREREELKRQQMRLEEARRSTKRPADDRREPYPDERKRIATDRRYEGSGRFEDRSESFENKKNTKMGTVFNHHATKIVNSNFDESRSSRRDRDGLVGRTADLPRRDHASPDSGGRKERFDRPSFRSREDHRGESDHRSKLEMRSRERYVDSGKGEGRYTDRSGDTWHSGGGPAPPKPFSSVPSPRPAWPIGDRDRKGDSGQSWGRPLESSGSDRWVSGGGGPMSVVSRGPGLSGPGMYPGPQGVSPSIPGMGLGLGPGPYSADRFDAYKQSLPIRKY